MLRRRTLGPLMAAASLAPLTAEAQGAPPLTRIAFGSCADQRRPQPIWDAILAYRPDLFVFMGDNVYGDFGSADAAPLREAYAEAAAIEPYARLMRTVPHLAVWDDHDYGRNDAGASFPHKQVSKELFLDFFHAPATDVRRTREGIYDSRIVGPPGMRVQVILLDIRWFKSPWKPTDQRGAPGRERYLPDPDPTKTMLGDAQWAWLATELRKPAELRLLVSSIQVLADGHGWERWGNFPLEREKLFAAIREARAGGVVMISGDRHIGALYRERPAGLYALTEATSSGLNQFYWAAREAGPNRLGELYAMPNFGVVDVDWWERSVTLALRDTGGTVRRSTTLRLDDLAFS
ncbi:MAG: alkaline phosphatase family protein [Enhydrobacter sp.]|nr:MAG: alkaline phosphatase family protein [Enhydrobacter sp.]